MVDHERDRELDQGDPGFLGDVRECVDDLELLLVRGAAHVEAGARACRGEAMGDSREAYILAKRANALRVQAEAVSWGQHQARINSLSPGIISTPLAQEEMSGPGAEGYRHMIATSAAQRIGTPADVADAAAVRVQEQAAQQQN